MDGRNKYYTAGLIMVFSLLSFFSTTFIRIPIPVSNGYFNLGDTFVMLSSILFGKYVGLFTGMIGPTLSDLVGYPQFAPATLVIKGIEGFIVGLIAKSGNKEENHKKVIFGLSIGVVIIVIGYFVFEAFVYPFIGQYVPLFRVTDFNAAIGELLPNFIQGLLSAILAYSVWKIFRFDIVKNQ